MNFDVYAYVFSGMDSEAYYSAAAVNDSSVWAVADGREAGAAKNLVLGIENLGKTGTPVNESTLLPVFEEMHPVFQRMNEHVSAAGVFVDGNDFHMFNIGNARVIAFSNGSMLTHTDDHSAAYRSYMQTEKESVSSYDRIRHSPDHLELWKALGLGDDDKPQFYPVIPVKKGLAMLVCTESFWRYLSVIEMELDYRKSAGCEEWIKIMVRRVLMNSNHGLDNENFAVLAVMADE